MKSIRLSSIIITIVSFGIIALFVYYLYDNRYKYLELLHISTPAMIILLVISFIYPVLNGVINIYTLQSLGTKISFWDGFLLAAASGLANLLPISGGLISKGVYLKFKYKISYTRFFGATLASYVCLVAANGFIGIVILLYWMVIKTTPISLLLLAFFFVMAVSLLTFWFPFNHLKLPAGIHKRLNQTLEGWILLSKDPTVIMKITGLQISLVLLLAIRYWIAFHMLSQNITMGQSILFACVAILDQLISIAPGGLGVREAIVGAIASTFGYDLTVSIAAVELDRLVATFVIVTLGWISTIIIRRQISEAAPTEPIVDNKI